MPVNVRRWYIRKFNKRQEEEAKANSKQKDPNQPLTAQEKARMISKAQQNQYVGSMKK